MKKTPPPRSAPYLQPTKVYPAVRLPEEPISNKTKEAWERLRKNTEEVLRGKP